MENSTIIAELRNEVDKSKILKLNNKVIALINHIILKIKNSSNIEMARESFLILENVQNELSTFLFRDGGFLLPPLKKFVRDFDRVDDDRAVLILFKLIKQNNYLL